MGFRPYGTREMMPKTHAKTIWQLPNPIFLDGV